MPPRGCADQARTALGWSHEGRHRSDLPRHRCHAELQFAVNHVGHFLLAALLNDLLSSAAPARVITVSFKAHLRGRIDLDRVMGGDPASYDGYQAYADSKLATTLFALQLARRLDGSGVVSNVLDPGPVITDMLTEYMRCPPPDMPAERRTPEEVAETAVWLATAPELTSVTGRYFEGCSMTLPSTAAQDVSLARTLWAWSETVTS